MMPLQNINATLFAGLSVTTAIATMSVLDGRGRRVEGRKRMEGGRSVIRRERTSASQEESFVMGNMVLATNL